MRPGINLKNIFTIIGVSIFLVLFYACTTKKGHPDEVVILGKLKNSRGEKMLLKQLCADSLRNVDSVVIDDNGAFSFRTIVNEPGFYILGTDMKNFVTLLFDKGEDIEFSGDALQLASDYNVKGSPGSALLWELNKHTRKNYHKTDSLFKILQDNQQHIHYDSIKHEIDSCLINVYNEQRNFVISFIKANPSSLASLIALYQVFGQQKVISEKEDTELYELLGKNLSTDYPGNPYVKELTGRLSVLKKNKEDWLVREAKLDSGNVAPEIVLNSIAGYPQKLSSLHGYTVLVYFWAGSSLQSQAVIPSYKYYFKKYSEKGFTILGVSLDKDRQTWEDAVRTQKLRWIQVSDLMEWESPAAKQYNVSSIPASFLIDRDGRIICKRPDEQTLANYLYRIYKF